MVMPISVKINTKDLKKIDKIVKRVKIQSNRTGEKIIRRLAENTTESARGFAPIGATGRLRDSIKAVSHGKFRVDVTAGEGVPMHGGHNYAKFQEYGFRAHGVPKGIPEVAAWIRNRGVKVRGKYLWVSRHTPFLAPAVNAQLNEGKVKRVINYYMPGITGK